LPRKENGMNLRAKIYVEKQKGNVQEKLNARLTLLKEKGLEDKLIQRDATLRQLKAQLRKANFRLARIAAQERLNQERAQAKIDKPALEKAAKEARKAAKAALKTAARKAEPEKKEKKAKKEKQAEPGGKAKGKKGK
jgi:hypothetical protein